MIKTTLAGKIIISTLILVTAGYGMYWLILRKIILMNQTANKTYQHCIKQFKVDFQEAINHREMQSRLSIIKKQLKLYQWGLEKNRDPNQLTQYLIITIKNQHMGLVDIVPRLKNNARFCVMTFKITLQGSETQCVNFIFLIAKLKIFAFIKSFSMSYSHQNILKLVISLEVYHR